MNPELSYKLAQFGTKLEILLSVSAEIPDRRNFLSWLVLNLKPSDFDLLKEFRRQHGKQEVEKWMLERLVASGRYQAAGPGRVQAAA